MKSTKLLFLLLFISILSCKETPPPTAFSQEALSDTFTNLNGESSTLKSILEAHKGKKVFIDIWASWCKDCIKGIPKVKELQRNYPNVDYVFFSLDRTVPAWKKGIEKLEIKGDNYYMQNAKKGAFAKFVDIDWIPRYMVLDEKGNIKLFKAIKADDSKITELLK